MKLAVLAVVLILGSSFVPAEPPPRPPAVPPICARQAPDVCHLGNLHVPGAR